MGWVSILCICLSHTNYLHVLSGLFRGKLQRFHDNRALEKKKKGEEELLK